jgi:glucokinase
MLVDAARMTTATSDTESWLIADIGATSSRCATLAPATSGPQNVRIYRNENFPQLTDLLADYLRLCDNKPQSLALAVAAPVHGDDIRMINRDWSFSGTSLSGGLGFTRVKIINDFHAIGYALPTFDDNTRSEIGHATEYRGGNMAVLGPGSGLGMSAWIRSDSAGAAMTGEGGHITVPGRNKQEDEIIAGFRDRFGHCSAERILSGPGLMALHKQMHGIELESPEVITGNPDDEACAATMNQFFSFLGGAAADLALITGAFGGLYIAGGIVPACIEQLRLSPFRERFDDKNRYEDYMRRIPTYVITDPVPGLTGLAAMIKRGRDCEYP